MFNAELLSRCTGLRHLGSLCTDDSSFIDATGDSSGRRVHTIKREGDVTLDEPLLAAPKGMRGAMAPVIGRDGGAA